SLTLESAGVVLIYGRGDEAIETGRLLSGHMDITVLLVPPAAVVPPRSRDFPVTQGRVRSAQGHLGAFELVVDELAHPTPSSRKSLTFGPARSGVVSCCDIVLDLTGGSPLFAGAELREGYLRADPGSPAAVLAAVLKARELTGTFHKPQYVAFDAPLCAHA